MSNSVTLLELRTEIRRRGEWRSAYISDAEINSYINDSIAALEDLVSSLDPSYFLALQDIEIGSGVRWTPLPSNFYKLVGVAMPVAVGINPDGYQALEQFNWEERYDYPHAPAKQDTRFHVRGRNIYWNPVPDFDETVRLEYIPSLTPLGGDVDIYNFFNHWQEWVVLDVCMKCAAKEETDPTVYAAQQKKTEARITKFSKRAFVTPQKSKDTTQTLRSLQLTARNRGGWTREQITDPQLTAWLNSSISALRDLICTHDPSYFVSYSDIAFSIDANEAALPSDFFKVVGVSYQPAGTSVYETMESFNWSERWDAYDALNYKFRYNIRGSNMYLHPTPYQFPEVIRVEYIPTFAGLSNPSDEVSLYNNWQEWVLLDVAIKAMGYTGKDPSVYVAQQTKVEKRIVDFDLRDLAEPTTDTDQSSLQSLRLAVRARGQWDKTVLNDSQLTNWVNASIAALRDMISAADERYFLTTHIIDVANGTRKYEIPSNFFKIVGLDGYDASIIDGYHTLNQFNWEERFDVVTSTLPATRYHIRGGYMYLHPTPRFNAKFKLEYIPTFTPITKPTDTTLLYNNWQEWVVLDCCIKASALAKTDPQVFLAQQQLVEKRIKEFDVIDLNQPTTPSVEGTLRGLQYAVRGRGAWTKEQINDSQLTAWINSSISALRDTILALDHSYFSTYDVLSVTAGNREYSVPADFFKLIGVDAYDSAITDGYQALNHFNWEERYDVATSSKLSTRYHLRGNTLYLQPTPTWSGTLLLEYIPTFTNLSEPADTVSLYDNWQEWVVLDCCVKCAALVGADPQVFMAQLQAVDKRIKDFVMRDLARQTTPSSDSSNLRDMQLGVRARGSWSKEDVDDSQLTAFINSSIGAFVDLVARHDSTLYLSRADVTIVSGTKEYNLPSDFYKLQGVAVEDTANQDGYVVLERFNFDERYDFAYVSQPYDTKYILYGNQIHFQPTPNWNGTVRVEYIPLPTPLSAPTDSFEFFNGWGEFVILDVCQKIAMLLDKSPQFWASQKKDVEDRIKRSAEQDIGKPKTVIDVYRTSKYNWWWG